MHSSEEIAQSRLQKVHKIASVPVRWYEEQKTSIGLRYRIIFYLSAFFGIFVFSILFIIFLITQTLEIWLLVVAFTILIVILPIALLITSLVFRSRLKLSLIDVPDNEIWYVEQQRLFGHNRIVRFVQGTGEIATIALDEIAYPFIEDPRIYIEGYVERVMTRDRNNVNAEALLIARFEPYRRDLERNQVSEIVKGGSELLINIAERAFYYGIQKAIRQSTYQMALQIPTSPDDKRNLTAVPDYIIAEFANYPDIVSTAITVLAIDYRPERPESIEKEIDRYRGYIEGISVGFDQAAESGTIPQILFTQFSTLRTLEGLPSRARFPANAYQLNTDIAELFDNSRENTIPIETKQTMRTSHILQSSNENISDEEIEQIARYTRKIEDMNDHSRPAEPNDVTSWTVGDMPKTVLHIEDETAIRKSMQLTFEAFLSDEGYIMNGVATKEAAIEELQENLYLLLILDIELKTNTEVPDIGGIEILEELERWGHLKNFYRVIVLSKEDQLMRRVMSQFRNAVVDFVPKTDADDDEFMNLVRKAIAQLGINYQLKIGASTEDWANPQKYLYWLYKRISLQLQENSNTPKKPGRERIFTEIEVVLRRLYNEQFKQILIEPFPHDNYPNFTKIRPVLQTDMENPSEMLIIGSKVFVSDIVQRFEDHVYKPRVTQHTNFVNSEPTPWLSGAVFSFPEPIDRLETFKDFYLRNKDTDIINHQLSILFKACQNWYSGETVRFEEGSLAEHYINILRLPLGQRFICIRDTESKIEGKDIEGFSFTLDNAHKWRIRHPKPLKIRSYGNFLAKNILLGTENRNQGLATIHLLPSHSIDFYHPLTDFARLEVDLKLNILSKNISLETFRRMELTLMPNENHKFQEDEVKKQINIIQHIRTESELHLRAFGFHQDEYWCSLLFNTLDLMIDPNSSQIARKRAIISAGILLRQLKLME